MPAAGTQIPTTVVLASTYHRHGQVPPYPPTRPYTLPESCGYLHKGVGWGLYFVLPSFLGISPHLHKPSRQCTPSQTLSPISMPVSVDLSPLPRYTRTYPPFRQTTPFSPGPDKTVPNVTTGPETRGFTKAETTKLGRLSVCFVQIYQGIGTQSYAQGFYGDKTQSDIQSNPNP